MSTAKSMAAQYLNGKRNVNGKSNTLTANRFKSSTSNLATNSRLQNGNSSNNNGTNNRLKSTSMTNLIVGDDISLDQNGQSTTKLSKNQSNSRLTRPASRNALDSIHNGMNAKYAQVQSKVLLQNIRPQAGSSNQASRIPGRDSSTLTRRSPTPKYGATNGPKVPNDRTVLLNKLKALQEELDKLERERELIKQEVEREKQDKQEQVQHLKQELQEKVAEHERQNEEYHQKLLEAYELADQNRRAADSVLNESRQRDEESKKRIDELELQLNELKEFVSMKEEMTNKMYELKEQIRQERERYEEQLKSLHQVFENEKISCQKSSQYEREFKHSTNVNSNYFNRRKGNLQSSESIDAIAYDDDENHHYKEDKLRRKQHRSEHDMMYGSKLSTRMQDGAKSAWKASKQFASSVITGSVSLTACRKRDLATGMGRKRKSGAQSMQVPVAMSAEPIVISVQPEPLKQLDIEANGAGDVDGDKHTSVVEVIGSSPIGADQVPFRQVVEMESDKSDKSEQSSPALIHVDKNNKLTIVTKFNSSSSSSCTSSTSDQQSFGGGCQSPAGSSVDNQVSVHSIAPTSVSCAGSERSRCESSSSGRGTSSSDTNSAASQNGDSSEYHSQAGSGRGGNNQTSLPPSSPVLVEEQQVNGSEQQQRGHKRRSSLFKASKVFGGSQVSLNKLKTFFVGTNGHNKHQQQSDASNHININEINQQQIENSRIRCMELNQAIKVPSMSVSTVEEQRSKDQDKITTNKMNYEIKSNGHDDDDDDRSETSKQDQGSRVVDKMETNNNIELDIKSKQSDDGMEPTSSPLNINGRQQLALAQ